MMIDTNNFVQMKRQATTDRDRLCRIFYHLGSPPPVVPVVETPGQSQCQQEDVVS